MRIHINRFLVSEDATNRRNMATQANMRSDEKKANKTAKWVKWGR
jgi:hypothetical protein